MAPINGWLSSVYQDGNKVPTTIRTFFSTASGLNADVLLWMAAYAPLLDAVTQGQLLKQYLHVEVANPVGLRATPVAGSNNMDGALIKFPTALAGEPYAYWLPNFLAAGFDPAHTNNVLVSQAAVAAWITSVQGTTNTTTIQDEDGNNLGNTVMRAVKSTRKYRRGLGRAR